MRIGSFSFTLFVVVITTLVFHEAEFLAENKVKFFVFKKLNDYHEVPLYTNITSLGCNPNDKIAIITHGWQENEHSEWVRELVNNLLIFRGGCVIFYQYDRFSRQEYVRLMEKFRRLSNILFRMLVQLEYQGYDPENIFMFGFSFGAQITLDAASRFGPRKIKNIDVCDPAGVGFDNPLIRINPRLAAQNVQCIHTSTDKGTFKRNCHQDWLMGICGRKQPAAGPKPKGDHGLCPYFYNSAFSNDFMAVYNLYNCRTEGVAQFPDGFKMGYMEDRKEQVQGVLFCPTSNQYPYNIVYSDSQDSTLELLNYLNETRKNQN